MILRLTLFDPKDRLGQDCSVVDAETFTRRPSAQAITHVAIHNFVVKAATGAGESAAGARLTISKDQQTWLDNNYAALVARDVQALEREKAACLWVMRAGARHLLWCILGSQGAKHAALASCGVAGKPC